MNAKFRVELNADAFTTLDLAEMVSSAIAFECVGLSLAATQFAAVDPAEVRRITAESGIALSSIDAQSMDVAAGLLDSARTAGVSWIRIRAPLQDKGESRGAAVMRFNQSLVPLADRAAEANIGLLIENANSFRDAAGLWTLLDQLNHPAVACAWNETRSAERPALIVPTLNLRISSVLLDEESIATRAATTRQLLQRLAGIGYGGSVSIGRAGMSREGLAQAIATVREWILPQSNKVKR